MSSFGNTLSLSSLCPNSFTGISKSESPQRRSFKFPRIINMADTTAARNQKITICNRHNEKLVGVFHDTGSADVVVLCHGFRSTKETKIMVNISASLEKKGISSFRFDFSGNGESEGTFQYGNYWREVEDTRSVVEYFIGASRKVAAIAGHSKGGNIVLLYGSKYHDISTIVNISGRYKLDGGIEERLGSNFFENIKKEGYIEVKSGNLLHVRADDVIHHNLNSMMELFVNYFPSYAEPVVKLS